MTCKTSKYIGVTKNSCYLHELILALFFALLTGFFFFKILYLPETRIALSFLLAFLAFSIYCYLRFGKNMVVKFCVSSEIIKTFFFATYVASILAVILIPPTQNNLVYIDWNSVPWYSIVRAIASNLLVLFLPGFVILQIIKGERKLLVVETIVFSYLLSVFFTSLTSFTVILVDGKLSNYGMPALLVVNVSLLLLYSVKQVKEGYRDVREFRGNPFEALILLCLVGIVVVIMLLRILYARLLPWWDQMYHHGNAYNILVGGFPPTDYPWWYYIFAASYYLLSGLPSVNAAQSLRLLPIFTVLSFYMMANALLRDLDPKIPIISTIFAMFAGFGWIYAVYQELTMDLSPFAVLSKMWLKTYDMGMSPIFFGPTCRALGFPSLFTLIYFLKKPKWLNRRTDILSIILPAVAVTNGFMAHIAEVLFFFIMLPLLCFIITAQEENRWLRELNLSLLLGLATITVFDFISPSGYYSYFLMLMPLYLLIAVAFTLLLTKRSYINFFSRFSGTLASKIKISKFLLMLLLIYIYGFCFITWYQLLPTINSSNFQFLGVQITPWFLYPMLLGTPGLLSILSLKYLNRKTLSNFVPFIALATAALLLGRLQRFVTFFMYHEYRIVTNFLAIATSAFASFTFVKVVSKVVRFSPRRNRNLLIALLVLLIVVSGMPSKLYRYEMGFMLDATMTKLSDQEINALNWLRENANHNDVILTPSLYSSFTVNTLVGVETIGRKTFIGPHLSQVFFQPTDPQVLFYLLDKLNVRYVYVSYKDKPVSGTLTKLLQFLPTSLNNSRVVIYQVPSFQAPSSSPDSFLAFIRPSKPRLNHYYVYGLSMIALSDMPYKVFIESDHNQFNSSVIALFPYMVSEKHIDWVKKGGTLLVLRIDYSEFAVSGNIALSFDGVDDYVEVPDAPSLNPTEQITVEAWVKPYYGGSYPFVVTKGLSGTNRAWTIQFYEDTLRPVFVVHPTGETEKAVISPDEVSESEWHHLVGTYDGQTIKLYVDGELKATYTESFTINVVPAPVTIGGYITSNYLKGAVDEIRIYNRALTEEEIRYSYYMRIPLNTSGLVAWWSFNEGEGNSVSDAGPYRNNGIIHGACWVKGSNMLEESIKISYIGELAYVDEVLFGEDAVSIPRISVPLIRFRNASVDVLGYYSRDGVPIAPIAYQQKIGKGRVIYLEISPIFNAMAINSGLESGKALFSALASLMEKLKPFLPAPPKDHQKHIESSDLSYAIGKISLEGDIQINSSYISFLNASLLVSELNLSATTILINGREEKINTLRNIKLEKMEIEGIAYYEINATKVEIEPSESSGSYVPLKIYGPFNLEINASKSQATLHIKINGENQTTSITVLNGTLRLTIYNPPDECAHVVVMASQPNFSTEGKLSAEALNKPNSRVFNLLEREWYINGEFKIEYSSNGVIILSNSNYEFTETKKPRIYQLRYDEMNIPWLEIFGSKLHILWILIVLLILVNFIKFKVRIEMKWKS